MSMQQHVNTARNRPLAVQVLRLSAAVAASLLVLFAATAQDEPRAPVAAVRPPVEAAKPDMNQTTGDEETGEANAEETSSSQPVSAARPAAAPKHNPADPAELEAFFDGVLLTQLESKHIAGATIAVVADGEIVFAKGYGFADYENRKPVNPETTMFRIGSVTKLLTWTAVMQLVEEGKLDLDTDINTYLEGSGVKIPETFSEPITLKHLLTHTPGFEDSVIGLFGRKASDVGPLEEILQKQLPRRVRKPGELASYSNHGTALAGLIVSQVSGLKWEDYIEQKIFKPLGMSHSTVLQLPAADLPEDLSLGYKYTSGRFEEEAFEYVPPAPAGSASSSAADMARFILAHLQDGECKLQRILKPDTARQMRERLFDHDPRLDAMCYGFWETNRNGRRILHHGGDTIAFHSLLAFLPEEGVGLFVSYNTDTAGACREQLLDAYLERYYPLDEQPRIKSPDGFEPRAEKFVGSYKFIRHDYTTLAKLQALVSAAQVQTGDDDTLVVSIGSGTRRFAEVDKLLFQEVDGQEQIAFREDDKGRITHMFMETLPAIALQKLTWYESPDLQLGLLGGCTLLFISALFGWPLVLFATRGHHIAGRRSTLLSLLFTWVGWLGCIVFLAFLIGFGYLVVREPNELVYGISEELELLLLLPQICAGFAGAMLLCALWSWGKGYWRFSGRVHYLLVALAGVGFVWFLYYWNLLKFGI